MMLKINPFVFDINDVLDFTDVSNKIFELKR